MRPVGTLFKAGIECRVGISANRCLGLLNGDVEPERPIRNVIYVIWRNPWMTVSKSTFIGSMLSLVGFGAYMRDFPEKYPKFNLADYEGE